MLSNKAVCLHFHIFKNAGTTIDSILEKNFSKNAVRIDIEKPNEILPMKVVLNYLKNNSEINAFSSHQMRFPIPKSSDFNLIPILFIRHPIDRIFSIYSYNKRRNDPRTIVAKKAKESTLKEFIEWFLQLKQNMVIKNFHVMYLSKNDTRSSVNNTDFELAVDRMKKCSILGVVDRLDESLVIAEEYLKKYFPNIDLSYIPKNVSNDRKGSLEQKLQEGEFQLGDSIWNELLANNKFDLKLFSLANEELNYRIKKIDSFQQKLKNFKNRPQKKIEGNLDDIPMLKNRRIWYSPEEKSLYYKNPLKGNKKILGIVDEK